MTFEIKSRVLGFTMVREPMLLAPLFTTIIPTPVRTCRGILAISPKRVKTKTLFAFSDQRTATHKATANKQEDNS
jgi:hypothetical protein